MFFVQFSFIILLYFFACKDIMPHIIVYLAYCNISPCLCAHDGFSSSLYFTASWFWSGLFMVLLVLFVTAREASQLPLASLLQFSLTVTVYVCAVSCFMAKPDNGIDFLFDLWSSVKCVTYVLGNVCFGTKWGQTEGKKQAKIKVHHQRLWWWQGSSLKKDKMKCVRAESDGVKIDCRVSRRSRSRGNVRDCVSCFAVVQPPVSASSPALTSSPT